MHTARLTGRPIPRSNYELFNSQQLKYTLSSWNYQRRPAPYSLLQWILARDLDCDYSTTRLKEPCIVIYHYHSPRVDR